VWGLGCAGGAAALARAAELARVPGSVVLVIALELCTLAYQPDDAEPRNLVAMALFSDGAAAAVVPLRPAGRGAAAPGSGRSAVRIAGSGSTLWHDTRDIMGWTIDARGLHVVLSRDLPAFVREHLRADVERVLERHGWTLAGLEHVVAHPGGPRVLEAYADALGLPPARFDHSREVLRRYGNMSSPTCLFVLERTLAAGDVAPGESALLAAMGPGFASEYVLLEGAVP
jgi:alkylresorcinol/alkylpyrone synthase